MCVQFFVSNDIEPVSDDRTQKDLPPAYFLSLSLENVRCFGPEQTLDLTDDEGRPAQWTVLLGDNGTGKTTLLEVLGGMVTAFEEYKDLEVALSLKGLFTPGLDLLHKEKEKESVMCGRYVIGSISSKYDRKDIHKFVFKKDPLDENGEFRFAEGKVPSSQETRGILGRGYGAARRMGTQIHYDQEEGMEVDSLKEEIVELPNAEEWLLQTDHAAKSGKSSAQRRLDQIKDVLANPDSGILPDVDDLRFAEQEGDTSPPRVEFHTHYGWVTIDQLSLGYRTMIAWVVDLARRLFDRYPESDNPLAEPAVCLVDEIDLHLHPKWQRRIIDFLSERFPNTQFIVTAHSPLVVQAAQDANIALMKRVEVEDGDDYVEIENNPARIRNWRVDQILTSDLFDLQSARPPKADRLMQKREKILAKEELTEEDKERLEEIEEEMGDLPTGETPDDIEAMNLIRQAARRLKEEAS